MNSAQDTLAGGLPHSEIPGSPIARISPGLFAACHVLHRLSVPRHPPDALTSRLITGVLSIREKTPHHRPRTGPKPCSPRFSRGASPRESGGLCQAASHEDTSSDRAKPCGPSLSASVTSQLSLFTLQSASTPRGIGPGTVSFDLRQTPMGCPMVEVPPLLALLRQRLSRGEP